MSPTDKQKYKIQATQLVAQLAATKNMLNVPIPPAPPPGPGPVMLQSSFNPLIGALKQQAEVIEKLAKLVGDVVDAS